MSATERYLALYIRVSTEEQATDGNSLIEQEEQLREFAAKHGHDSYRIYKDEGFSAKTLQRPGMQAMLRDVRQGRISGVVTTRIDRLTRRVSDFAKLVDELNHYGVFYRSTRQNFEIGTAMGRLMVVILSAIAEFEREMISERVFENLHSMVRRGVLATKPSFGYRVANGQLVLDEHESYWARRAARLLQSGHGARAVAKFLNDNGVRSKQGRLWSDRSVRALFQNPVLTGTLTWNRRRGGGRERRERDPAEWIVIPNHHEPVISEDVFAQINEMMTRRAKFAPHARHGARLLSGIARCGFCGASMHAGWQVYNRSDGRQRRKTYRCGRYASGGGCVINRVDADELDSFVVHHLLHYVDQVPFGPELSVWNEEGQRDARDTLADLRRTLRRLDERFTRLLDALGLGVITSDEFAEARTRLDMERSDIDQRIQHLQETIVRNHDDVHVDGAKTDAVSDFIARLTRSITDPDPGLPMSRAIVLELVDSVRVFRPDWRAEPEVEITFRI